MLISFLETDHWAHSGRYDYTLKAAHRVDQYIQKLWETVQSIRQYRGKTTFIITTDHGRGPAPTQWKNHGEKVPNAENIWMAFIGPDTPALGERQNVPRLTQGQVAATIAALLGENYKAFAPNAAQPVEAVVQVK
jgi:bisphosphoglycerate-independent phosphoglycerate mutase (AlkP superfamily)